MNSQRHISLLIFDLLFKRWAYTVARENTKLLQNLGDVVITFSLIKGSIVASVNSVCLAYVRSRVIRLGLPGIAYERNWNIISHDIYKNVTHIR